MEEKILIEGEFSPPGKGFKIAAIAMLIVAIGIIILSVAPFIGEGLLVLFLLAVAVVGALFPLGLALVFFILYKNLSKKKMFELVVTEARVMGIINSQRVDLPVNQISSISTVAPRGVSIATSSGTLSFLNLLNQTEVYECLSELIRKQREPASTKPTEHTSSISEQLVELKALLDQGIITQEEYDIKKRQLLGL